MTNGNGNKSPDYPETTPGFVDFQENVFFWYGIPKIGKTTLASKFPDALFFQTEEGTKHVKVTRWQIKSWLEFCKRVVDLEKHIGEWPFKTVVIDTADNLSDLCDQFICHKYGLTILGDLDYGKGFSYYRKEFEKQLNCIIRMGLGLIFISHAQEKEVKLESWMSPYAPLRADVETGKIKMVVPTLERRAMQFLMGASDAIFYIELDSNNKRVIRTQPTKHFEAGDRSGRLPETVPLDYEMLLEHYYAGNGKEIAPDAKTTLIERINTAITYLSQHQIDGFDSPARATNSIKKHLGVDILREARLPSLQSYLQSLRIKAKAHKPKETKA